MFKKAILAIALAIPMLASAQSVKIGLVNAQSIVPDMPEYKTAQTTLEGVAKKWDDEYKKMTDEAQAKFTEFQNMPQDTPKAMQERKAQELQEMQGKLQQFEQTAQQDLQQQQQTLMASVMQKVQQAIEAVGKEGNYTIIQEKAAVLYFGAPAEDITAAVRARLGLK